MTMIKVPFYQRIPGCCERRSGVFLK